MSRGIVLPAAVAALLGSGCVAWNVGEPVSHVEQVGSRLESKTLAERPVSARPVFSQPDGKRFRVGLSATVEKDVEMREIVAEKTVTTQNRMSFGLFPGWADFVYEQEPGFAKVRRIVRRAKQDTVRDYAPAWLHAIVLPPAAVFYVAVSLTGGVIYTPYAMFVEPFSGSYECFRPPHVDDMPAFWSHMAIVGFHRYQATSETPPVDRTITSRRRTETGERRIPGPWQARLSIPAIRYERTVAVPRAGNEASFEIPPREGGGMESGTVTILPPANGGAASDAANRTLFARLEGTSHSVRVAIPVKPAPRGGAGIVVTNVVVHQHPSPSAPEIAPYAVLENDYANGTGRYLIEITDSSKTGPEIHELVAGRIEREVRDAYLAENPGVPADAVRAHAAPSYQGAERKIRYEVSVFSLVPEVDGFSYDDVSRTGVLKLRVPPNADLAAAKRYVRENISAIVLDKNAVIRTGEPPPRGAKYRSLDENYVDGILTVEFEAAE